MEEKDTTPTEPKEQQTSDIKPDPETLHTTDPQDSMKGPLSSLVNSAKETIEEGNENKAEADEEKEENQ